MPHTSARKKRAVESLTAIEVQPWGERSFYASDPFDNPICFVDSETLFIGRTTAIG